MVSQEAKRGAVLSGLYGAAVGASCGSVAAYVGLTQACKMGRVTEDMCNQLMNAETETAISAGAAVGGSMGLLIGTVAYATYRSFMGWCYPRQRQQGVQLVPQAQPRSDEDPRVSISVNK